MTLLVIYVVVALGFSFLCSLLEATLLTVTPSAIQAAKTKGEGWAKRMDALKRDIDKPLSAILTLNTIAHTMGATGAGAQYTKVYGSATGGIFAGALTLAVLVLTEIIPKTLGARYAGFFAKPTAYFLPWLQASLSPIVWACQQITRLISFGKAHGTPQHREELLAVAKIATKAGDLNLEESRILHNILELGSVHVSDIMTPRPVMYCLPADMSFERFAHEVERVPFSRIPIYGENADDILGFVLRSDGLHACIKTPNKRISTAKRPIEAVPNIMQVDRLLEQMLKKSQHLVLVEDEFGTVVGLVTLEDVIETLMGVEIVDEQDKTEDMQELARQLWLKRAKRMGLAENAGDGNSGKS
ncbi:MAG: hemolysin family protein [Akkermansiaceae bacterium]|nr:hemolysin family protein [Akkermansiaceae bacterium]